MAKRSDDEYLDFDFADGDKDAPELRLRSVKMVTTRKPHPCSATPDRHAIEPGSRARREKAIFEGTWTSWYACIPCMDKYLDEFGP